MKPVKFVNQLQDIVIGIVPRIGAIKKSPQVIGCFYFISGDQDIELSSFNQVSIFFPVCRCYGDRKPCAFKIVLYDPGSRQPVGIVAVYEDVQ